MAIYGYARVSTKEQNLDRQITALEEAGCVHIYQEKITGKTMERAQLKRLLADLKPGDVVIVKELTRISRSTVDLLGLVQQISEKGAFIKSIAEKWLDTSSPSGKLMLTVMAGISEFETALRAERCKEGIVQAHKRGVKFGRPKSDDEQLKFAIELYGQREMSVKQICEKTGVSKSTLMRRVRELHAV
ncbi:recombinase family protein [Clostridium felsineum]|uniref:recombinase family protein n=1 Tax=Clostridium felsineum TaxID=36839 RepID=UPI00098CBF6A|nr:recombinase family protein [Clostridium felsineum]URZ16871.1 DNA-invertase hin [Clostridium felsineum DSM 794]